MSTEDRVIIVSLIWKRIFWREVGWHCIFVLQCMSCRHSQVDPANTLDLWNAAYRNYRMNNCRITERISTLLDVESIKGNLYWINQMNTRSSFFSLWMLYWSSCRTLAGPKSDTSYSYIEIILNILLQFECHESSSVFPHEFFTNQPVFIDWHLLRAKLRGKLQEINFIV